MAPSDAGGVGGGGGFTGTDEQKTYTYFQCLKLKVSGLKCVNVTSEIKST